MKLNDYQKKAMTTCMASSENFGYMFLNLVGEVGELASKIAKAIRKKQLFIGNNQLISRYGHNEAEKIDEFEEELQKEAGDVLWQLSGLCSVMGWNLEDIAQQNLDKLASRKERHVIDGNGDNR